MMATSVNDQAARWGTEGGAKYLNCTGAILVDCFHPPMPCSFGVWHRAIIWPPLCSFGSPPTRIKDHGSSKLAKELMNQAILNDGVDSSQLTIHAESESASRSSPRASWMRRANSWPSSLNSQADLSESRSPVLLSFRRWSCSRSSVGGGSGSDIGIWSRRGGRASHRRLSDCLPYLLWPVLSHSRWFICGGSFHDQVRQGPCPRWPGFFPCVGLAPDQLRSLGRCRVGC